jgi:hypothetical protein
MIRELIEGEAARPIAAVTGYHGGYCVIEPLDRAVLLPVGMALYSGAQAAVPDTHRIVSVELLESVHQFTAMAAEHYSGMNDDVCQSYSEPWQRGVAVCKELCAIIDNKDIT